jgi:radical SAM protein with 4Fe4S-binding SPASM domain
MKSKIKQEMIVFNHFYTLKHDLKRSYILGNNKVSNDRENFVNKDCILKIHPIYPMIFSFLSQPISLDIVSENLSCFLNISKVEAKKMISTFINNQEPLAIDYGGTLNIFPKNILIDSAKSFVKETEYYPEQFVYEDLNFVQERFINAPLGVVFMVNNTCKTDCIYCYADKSTKRQTLSFDRIKYLIKNAKRLNVSSFDIVGGEFFLYREWKLLLDTLNEYDYKPSLISTKVPLNEKDIKDFSMHNIPIQISLDSLNPSTLAKMLKGGNGYSEKIRKTLFLLEEYNVPFQIATVLTTYNNDIENLEVIHDFIKQFKNLSRWEIRVAFKSLYSKENFDSIKLSKDKIEKIGMWIDKKKVNTNVNILWSPSLPDKYFKSEEGSRKFLGSRCSANYSHMVIMPDGDTTICEQLYWNPRFIIGNVNNHSIEEVWNSKRALELAFPQKKDFRKESVCSTCQLFDDCFSFPNRCIADVLKGYGNNNWDYPDPRCQKAPDFENNLFYL